MTHRLLKASVSILAIATALAATSWAQTPLKQSTAVTLKLGPFVDETDGRTAETALTLSQADIRLSKNGAAFAQKNESTTATHDENGVYGVPLNTTDVNTLGLLQVCVNEAGALPVTRSYIVQSAAVFDGVEYDPEFGGRVWYVAASGGSDSNAGTRAAPLATGNAAVTAASLNDTIDLGVGTHAAITSSKDNLHFRGHGWTSIVQTSATTALQLDDLNTCRDLYVDGNLASAIDCQNKNYVTVERCKLDAPADCIYGGNGEGLIVRDCEVNGEYDLFQLTGRKGFLVERCVMTGTLTVSGQPGSAIINDYFGTVRDTRIRMTRTAAGTQFVYAIQLSNTGQTQTAFRIENCDVKVTSTNASHSGLVAAVGGSNPFHARLVGGSLATANTGSGSTYDIQVGSSGSLVSVDGTYYDKTKVSYPDRVRNVEFPSDELLATSVRFLSSQTVLFLTDGPMNDGELEDRQVLITDANADRPPSVHTISSYEDAATLDTDVVSNPATQTLIILTDGPPADDAWNGLRVVFTDTSNGGAVSTYRTITDSVESSNIIITDTAPDFTLVAGDGAIIQGLHQVTLVGTPTFTVAEGDTAKVVLDIPAGAEMNLAANALDADAVAASGATEIGDAAGGSGGPISPAFVNAAHTFRFDTPTRITANNTITETTSFDGLIRMDLANVMAKEVDVHTIDAVAITPTAGAEPVLGTAAKTPDGKGVDLPIDCTIADEGQYTVLFTFTTTDGQVLTRKGTLPIEADE